jgi:uncharacterized CHY-type Zn-finger protein
MGDSKFYQGKTCKSISVLLRLINCWNCKTELSNEPIKEWNYRAYIVKMFTCNKCQKSTNAYFKQGTLNHTIPMKGKISKKASNRKTKNSIIPIS